MLRSALSTAVREELIERNVAELVTAPRQRKRRVLPWSSEEARRFLESARSESDPMYAAYVLVVVLGLRKGEVLGLRWDAVDLRAREVVVDHQLQRVRRSLQARLDAGEAWQRIEGGPDLVFTGRYGTPVDPRTLNSRFTARCERAGVRRLDGARRASDLRDAAGRSGRASARHYARAAPRRPGGDDGDLCEGQLGRHPGGAAAARGVPELMACCCTLLLYSTAETESSRSHRTLTRPYAVGVTGFEPAASWSRNTLTSLGDGC